MKTDVSYKNLYMNIRSSIIDNSQKVGAFQLSVN